MEVAGGGGGGDCSAEYLSIHKIMLQHQLSGARNGWFGKGCAARSPGRPSCLESERCKHTFWEESANKNRYFIIITARQKESRCLCVSCPCPNKISYLTRLWFEGTRSCLDVDNMQVSQSERNTMWKAVAVLFFCFVVDSSSFFAHYLWHGYGTAPLPWSVKLVFVVCFFETVPKCLL